MSLPEGRTVHAASDDNAIAFDLTLYGDAYTDGEVEGAGWLLPLLSEALLQPLDHAVIHG